MESEFLDQDVDVVSLANKGIPKEVRTDLWLSNTSDAEKSVRL